MTVREEKCFGQLLDALPDQSAYLADYPHPVLVIDPLPPSVGGPGPDETPKGYFLARPADPARAILRAARVEWLGKSDEHPFGQVVSVGRTSDNDVVIDHTSVSKVHAAFREEGGRWFVEDMHSTNGTVIDALALKPLEPRELCDGTELFFGEVQARFYLPQTFWQVATKHRP